MSVHKHICIYYTHSFIMLIVEYKYMIRITLVFTCSFFCCPYISPPRGGQRVTDRGSVGHRETTS